jgi:hypothetical protein
MLRSHEGPPSTSPIFSALDSCPRLPTENGMTIAPQTRLLIPFKDICKEDSQERFKFSKFLQAQKAYHFFEQGFPFKWCLIQKQVAWWLS